MSDSWKGPGWWGSTDGKRYQPTGTPDVLHHARPDPVDATAGPRQTVAWTATSVHNSPTGALTSLPR
jgi:hypothetical protein